LFCQGDATTWRAVSSWLLVAELVDKLKNEAQGGVMSVFKLFADIDYKTLNLRTLNTVDRQRLNLMLTVHLLVVGF